MGSRDVSESADEERPPRARLVVLLVLVLLCVGCDQVTKRMATEHLVDRPLMSFLGDTVRVQYALNTGAFLGLGADWPPRVRFWVLTVGTSIFLLAMGWVLFKNRQGGALELAALALVIGGGLGNMIDRLFNDGVVVDFLNLGIGTLRTGIFNVADAAITAGVLLLIAHPLLPGTGPKASTPRSPAAGS